MTPAMTDAERALAADTARCQRAQLATALINAGLYMRCHLDEVTPPDAALSFAEGLLSYRNPVRSDLKAVAS